MVRPVVGGDVAVEEDLGSYGTEPGRRHHEVERADRQPAGHEQHRAGGNDEPDGGDELGPQAVGHRRTRQAPMTAPTLSMTRRASDDARG